MKLRPLLAESVTVEELDDLTYPLLGFYKYDGIRALVHQGRVLSRKLKLIPNQGIQGVFGRLRYNGLDGELIVGRPTAPDCYNRTESRVMTRDADALGVTFYVFDYFLKPALDYVRRQEYTTIGPQIKYAPCRSLKDKAAVLKFEQQAVALGYEGIMLRDPRGLYKFGRSTLHEQILLKLKRFEDSEAKIRAVRPRMKNNNKLERDERGYAKRSSKKEGKVATEELGMFEVIDIKRKLVFDCGPGRLTQDERRELWVQRDLLVGKVIKYRFQPAGVKELPRFPRFIGWRSRIDF